MTWLFVVALAGAAPLAETVPGDAVAWAHAPDLARTIRAVRQTPWRDLIGLFAPPAAEKALLKTDAPSLLAALYAESKREAEMGLWVRSGPNAVGPVLEVGRRWWGHQGFTAGPSEKHGPLTVTPWTRGRTQLFGFNGADRLGWHSRAEIARTALDRATTPLNKTPAFPSLSRRFPDGHLHGYVDVARLYGILARTRKASLYSGLLTRAGLIALRGVALGATLQGNDLHAGIDIEMPVKPVGFFEALGPPAGAVQYTKAPPKELVSVWQLSVVPAKILWVCEKLLAYYSALRYGVWAAHLDGIEQRTGKHLDHQILGLDPQLLTVFRLATGNKQSWVAVLPVKDGKAALAFAEALSETLPAIDPNARVDKKKVKAHTLLVVRSGSSLALGFDDRHLSVSDSSKGLERFWAREKQLTPKTGPKQVLASGVHASRREAELFCATSGACSGLGSRRAKVLGTLGQSRWTFARVGDGYRLDVETQPRR